MTRPKGPQHGTPSCYVGGCRRPECRRANTKAKYKRRKARYAYVLAHGLPAGVKHGTGGYKNWGCRCEVCTTEATRDWVAWDHRRRDALTVAKLEEAL